MIMLNSVFQYSVWLDHPLFIATIKANHFQNYRTAQSTSCLKKQSKFFSL